MKTCYKCKESKPLVEFGKNKSQNDGHQTYCKICANAIRREAPSYTTTLRIVAVNKLGGKCVRCGFFDIRALVIDHINGGGNAERRDEPTNGPKSLYRRIANGNLEDFINDYQVLCANCNSIKKIENKEFGRYENGQYLFGDKEK